MAKAATIVAPSKQARKFFIIKSLYIYCRGIIPKKENCLQGFCNRMQQQSNNKANKEVMSRLWTLMAASRFDDKTNPAEAGLVLF